MRLEVGSAAGRADLFTLDLPANQQAFSATAPPGSYFARVRALAGVASSMTTPDVTFAVGAAAAAPLDFTAIAAGPLVTFAWQPPSTGAPVRYELEAGTAEGRRDIGAIGIAGAATTLTVNAPIGRFWTRLVAVTERRALGPGQRGVHRHHAAQQLQHVAAAEPRGHGRGPDGDADLAACRPTGPRIRRASSPGAAPGQSDIATLTAAPYSDVVLGGRAAGHLLRAPRGRMLHHRVEQRGAGGRAVARPPLARRRGSER